MEPVTVKGLQWEALSFDQVFSIKCFLNLDLLPGTVLNVRFRLGPVFSSAKARHWEPAMTRLLRSPVPAEELLLMIETYFSQT